MKLKLCCAFAFILAAPAFAADAQARNIILFLGDAAGIPILNASSILGYGEPRRLFVQNMAHVGLSETSSASAWVTDSAAGMTAIVTGYKTHNGVISQSESAVRGKKDGEPLKTILEYAEERGLSTGVVSNSNVASATPAACYAQVNDRKKLGEIFAQVLKPRFGDGVDVIIGPGRTEILDAGRKLGLDLEASFREKERPLYRSLEEVPEGASRAIVVFDGEDYDLNRATQRAIDILSRNPKGFFLMVESNLHTNDPIGFERTIAFDRSIRETSQRIKAEETLLLFTADHSFDTRVIRGRKGEPLSLPQIDKESGDYSEAPDPKASARIGGSHTGEEVLAAAQGPGAERVRGFFSNTELFHIMMAAYGWKPSEPQSAIPKKSAGR